jgi:hypothetical protein
MSSVSIELTIAGLRYPLRVDQQDEALLRKAEGEINERLKQLQGTPGARSVQDHMALLLVSTWVDNMKQQKTSETNLRLLEQKLQQIVKLMNGLVTETNGEKG